MKTTDKVLCKRIGTASKEQMESIKASNRLTERRLAKKSRKGQPPVKAAIKRQNRKELVQRPFAKVLNGR